MTEPEPSGTQTEASGASRSSTGRRTRGWIAAATFLLGLLVGAVVVGLLSSGSDASPSASDAASPSATPSSGGVTVSPGPGATAQAAVNDACLRAVNAAQDAYGAIGDIGAAARRLDAGRLDEIIRRLQPLQQQLRSDLENCRVVTTLPDGSTVSRSPTVQPEPTAGTPGLPVPPTTPSASPAA